jgi:hypothetical protein
MMAQQPKAEGAVEARPITLAQAGIDKDNLMQLRVSCRGAFKNHFSDCFVS